MVYDLLAPVFREKGLRDEGIILQILVMISSAREAL